jgi:hydroxymethylglutaryl-CoA reductase (NADPH)
MSDKKVKFNPKNFDNHNDRRKGLERETSLDLSSFGSSFADENNLTNVHCENLVGAISLPLGLAGPVKIKGQNLDREVVVPLATSEGALIASVARGMKAINESGGAKTFGSRTGTTRAPVFKTHSLEDSHKFTIWLEDNFEKMKEVAESTSNHLKLLKIDTKILATDVFVRFYYATGDAMGMNMVTIGTEQIVDLIEKELNYVRCVALSGNYCVDKKPSWQNFINSRGFEVWAEVDLTADVLEKVLKTNAEDFYRTWKSKCMYGSMMSGSLGFNAHFANIIGAFFASSGQDLAQVVEGSHGVTTAELSENGGLTVGIYMPAVMIATVGGGTKLTTQRQVLNIMGAKTSVELSEILGASVLAGELSLISSLSIGGLAGAHAKFGRNKICD